MITLVWNHSLIEGGFADEDLDEEEIMNELEGIERRHDNPMYETKLFVARSDDFMEALLTRLNNI